MFPPKLLGCAKILFGHVTFLTHTLPARAADRQGEQAGQKR